MQSISELNQLSKLSTGAQPDYPLCFLCPITNKLMQNPTKCLSDGYNYEKAAIKNHIRQSKISPVTGATLTTYKLCELPLLKEIINKYINQYSSDITQALQSVQNNCTEYDVIYHIIKFKVHHIDETNTYYDIRNMTISIFKILMTRSLSAITISNIVYDTLASMELLVYVKTMQIFKYYKNINKSCLKQFISIITMELRYDVSYSIALQLTKQYQYIYANYATQSIINYILLQILTDVFNYYFNYGQNQMISDDIRDAVQNAYEYSLYIYPSNVIDTNQIPNEDLVLFNRIKNTQYNRLQLEIYRIIYYIVYDLLQSTHLSNDCVPKKDQEMLSGEGKLTKIIEYKKKIAHVLAHHLCHEFKTIQDCYIFAEYTVKNILELYYTLNRKHKE